MYSETPSCLLSDSVGLKLFLNSSRRGKRQIISLAAESHRGSILEPTEEFCGILSGKGLTGLAHLGNAIVSQILRRWPARRADAQWLCTVGIPQIRTTCRSLANGT